MADKAGENIIDARDAAEAAGLVYIDDQGSGIIRRRSGKGWSYRDSACAKISDKAVIGRINKIGIPPAYTDVWICADERGHIQATGRDAKGRKQYRYHERFHEVRDSTKYEHMLTFAEVHLERRQRLSARDQRQRHHRPGLPHLDGLHDLNLQWHPRAEEWLWRPDIQERKWSQSGMQNLRYKASWKRQWLDRLLGWLDEALPYCEVR